MRNFPSEEALVAAYWRKLARSIERTYKSSAASLRGGGTAKTKKRLCTVELQTQMSAVALAPRLVSKGGSNERYSDLWIRTSKK